MLIKLLKGLASDTPSSYHLLKKDDDLGAQHLTQFKQMCEVDTEILRCWSTKEIKNFAQKLVMRAQDIPITADNVDDVKKLLCKIANLNGRYQAHLSEALHKTKIDIDLRKKLIVSVNLQSPIWS